MSLLNQDEQNSKFQTSSIIDDLENGFYLKSGYNNFFKEEVKTKIEEFSHWFNSTARLYLLKCEPEESETYVYLLLNLKKKLKYALSEINKSVNGYPTSLTCSTCEEKINIQPFQDMWTQIQDHPHFEECYSGLTNVSQESFFENGESSTTNESTVDDLSEELEQVNLAESTDGEKSQDNEATNDFKFNFSIPYDQRIEEFLYPESLVSIARKLDLIKSEYTIQRCGVNRAVCLLCSCNLMSKGKVSKVSSFIIRNHVSGQKHMKFASLPVNRSALRNYHEFWRSQEPTFQAHQVHFIPEVGSDSMCRCQLCQEFVKYNGLLHHIKDLAHMAKVIKLFNSPEGKLNDFYLLDMQVEVYGISPLNNVAEKGDKSKENKNKTNIDKPSKCVIVKFAIEPNGFCVPPRYKDHLKFFTDNSNEVTCRICKVTFINSTTHLRDHILNLKHQQLAGIAVPKFSYYCEVCNMYLKDEDTWADHFLKGPNRHDTIPAGRRIKLAEYECKTCKVVIYGDELSLSRHISSRGAKIGKAKEIKLPYSIEKLFKSKASIEDEGTRMSIEATRVLEYQDKMKECCDDLQQALSSIYPNCRAYPFGSRISGLGNNQSDLDVFMDIGEMYLGGRFQDSPTQEKFVVKATKLLKSFKEDFSYVLPIPSARTPIVKLHHNYTNLDCDISFRHGLGVENTKFVRFCIDLQPITQPFILLLKRWSEYCKLNEHITNYGLALMGIFFLQTEGYLLSVKTVRSYNSTQSLIIDGWETLNYTVPIEKMRELVKPFTSNMKDLLRRFFYYFCKFDYANDVVCPLLGSTIPKLLFHEPPNGEKLPAEMKSYVQRIQIDSGEQFRGLTPFCIQDPFDLSHNLTKACQHGTISKLKTFCALTYEFLDTIE